MKDQPVPLVKDFEKLKGKLEQKKRDAPGLSQLQGKNVCVYLRGGSTVEGTITSVQTYELEVITKEKKRLIVLKHAVDYIEVVS